MNINDINKPETQNSRTGVFAGHHRDKSHSSRTIPAIPGQLVGMISDVIARFPEISAVI